MSYNERIILLVVPLCVVPTESTENTEAYGLKLFESTERIDAARHTTEGTELIACVASPRLSIVRRLWRRKQSFLDSCIAKRRLFCGFQKLKPVGFCVLCEFRGNYKQKIYKYKRGCRLNIIRPLHESEIIRSLHEHQDANLPDKPQFAHHTAPIPIV